MPYGTSQAAAIEGSFNEAAAIQLRMPGVAVLGLAMWLIGLQ